VLHVTNGDSAATHLRAASLPGDIVPWRDVLHEGPVPAGLDPEGLRVARAAFLAALGWASEERVRADMRARDERLEEALRSGERITLWFESDLYDMLQLAQVLDRIPPGGTRLVLTGEREFRGVVELEAGAIEQALEGGDPGGGTRVLNATAPVVAAGRALWAAFRASEPDGLHGLASATPALPALADAARRHLQQFPWRGSGLNRTERALLEAVAAGARTPVEAFLAHQRQEERPFMGDATALYYLSRLASGMRPLLDTEPELQLTGHGHAVLRGDADWEGRPERWLGGIRLEAGPPRWRYDPALDRVVAG
jgi:hypothetical protein